MAENGHLDFSIKRYDVSKVLIKYALLKTFGY